MKNSILYTSTLLERVKLQSLSFWLIRCKAISDFSALDMSDGSHNRGSYESMDTAALIQCVKLDYSAIAVLWSVRMHTQTGFLKSCRATSTHQGHRVNVCARECVLYTTLKCLYFIYLCPNLRHGDPEKAVSISLERHGISSHIHHVTLMTGKETTWPLPCLNPVLFSGV